MISASFSTISAHLLDNLFVGRAGGEYMKKRWGEAFNESANYIA